MKNTKLHVTIAPNKPATVKLSTLSGKGPLQAIGQVELTKAHYPFTLTITGHQMTILNNLDFHVIISPTIIITGDQLFQRIKGRVDIPFAKFSPRDFNTTVTLPPETTFVEQKKSHPFYQKWQHEADIQVVLGKNVTIDSSGLTGQLAGQLTLAIRPNRVLTGSGEIHLIKGQYHAYGQALKIDKGRLQFNGGPLDNPGIELTASKTLATPSRWDDIKETLRFKTQRQPLQVGVKINDRLLSPKIKLFSNPAGYSQADILSMIILGYPIHQASHADSNFLLGAMGALGLGRLEVNQLTNRLGHELRLDSVAIKNQTQLDPATGSLTQNPSLVIGKAISKRLYISYNIGLLHSRNLLRIQYLLNHYLTLQSTTDGTNNGVDLLYTIQRP